MTLILNGKKYYRTAEACKIAGTSRNTYLRWVREGQINDVETRDRKGWRLFTEDNLRYLMNEVGRMEILPFKAEPKKGPAA